MALATRTAMRMGMAWVIWPVISNTITEMERVWVTAPVKAAAPTVA